MIGGLLILHPSPQRRAAERIVPLNTTVLLRSGCDVWTGYILNVSRSGVGIASSKLVEVDMVLTIGRRPAKVTRVWPTGFGAQFLTMISDAEFSQNINL